MLQITIRTSVIRSVHFVEFYNICPTNAEYIYIDNICFLKHSYMFRCLYVIRRESLINFCNNLLYKCYSLINFVI